MLRGSHPELAYRAFDLKEAGPQRIAQMLPKLVIRMIYWRCVSALKALHRLPVKSRGCAAPPGNVSVLLAFGN